MKYLPTLIVLFTLFSLPLLCSAGDNEGAADKKEAVRNIPEELKVLIERIRKLSEDEAFADMDRSIKMGNKTRLKVTLYVYPKLKNRQDTFKRTPLYNAVYAGQLELVKYLLNKHALVALPDVDGDTPLHRAAADGSCDIIKLLLQKGAKYYAKNKKERTPLFSSALNGEVDAAKLLMEAGDRVNRQDKNGDTPLHLASLKGEGKMVKYLLANGADFTVKNKKGKRPVDVAKNAEIKKLLTK